MDLRRAGIAIWAFVLFGGIGIVAMIAAAPALRLRSPEISAMIYAVFAPLCHQVPERCLTFKGFPLAVCGRCSGIYIGFVAGTLLFPFVRGFARTSLPSLRLFAAVSLPIALDASGNFLGAWNTPIAFRFATGTLWGAILPFFVIPGALDLVRSRREKPARGEQST
jgi:uncharacterized membrane protein